MPEYSPGRHTEEIPHECEAIHCPICCPVRVAYDEGWNNGVDWGKGGAVMTARIHERHQDESKRLYIMLGLGILIGAVWFDIYIKGKHDSAS